MAVNNGNVTLGSGDLYIMEFEDAMPDTLELEVAANKVGSISGGATLSYSPEIYEVVNDYGHVLKRFITKEEVTFKSGVLTWNLDVLNLLTMRGEITSGTGKRTLTIGKQGSMKEVVIRFVHTMDNQKKIRVTLKGTAGGGFELLFDPSKETVVDAEISALSQTDGTLVTIEIEE